MAGYCTLVLYFHSPAARENMAAHSCNIQPCYLLTHQIIYIYSCFITAVFQHTLSTVTLFFDGLVRCSAYRCFFVRLRYQKRYTQISSFTKLPQKLLSSHTPAAVFHFTLYSCTLSRCFPECSCFSVRASPLSDHQGCVVRTGRCAGYRCLPSPSHPLHHTSSHTTTGKSTQPCFRGFIHRTWTHKNLAMSSRLQYIFSRSCSSLAWLDKQIQ